MTARTWSNTSYEDVITAFRVKHVMTRIENALCVSSTETVEAAAYQIRSHNFDCAPVTNGEKIVAIFEAKSAESSPYRLVAEVAVPLSLHNTVNAYAPLAELPSRLCECHFRIVLAKKKPVGLVSVADLNKTAMRSLIFLHIADAEAKMAELIRREYQGNDDWLNLLSNERREKILKSREDMSKGNVDLNLLESAYFNDLLTVIQKSTIGNRMKPLLKWSLAKHDGGIKELRGSTCHPVRPLLQNISELPKLVERLQRLRDLIHAAEHLPYNECSK